MCLSLKLICCLWESLLDLTVAVTCKIYVMFGSYNLCRFNRKLGPTGKESDAEVFRKKFADPYTVLIFILKGVL